MKKVLAIALLAIAGATSAYAGAGANLGPSGYHYEFFRIECPDGFVYEKIILVQDGCDVDHFRKSMENTLCSE